MKKAFTMIEIIFVIAILGVLSAVALPRLFATMDDADIATTAKNLSTIVSDIGVYYSSQARLAPNLKDMTNVDVLHGDGLRNNVILSGRKKPCIVISLIQEGEIATDTAKPIHLKLSRNENGVILQNGENVPGQQNNAFCVKLWQANVIANMLKLQFNYVSKVNDRYETRPSDDGEIPLGGSRVKW